MLNVGDCMIMICQSIYYSYSKHWESLHYFGFFASIAIINMVSMLPESPKYLYANGKFDEARAVIGYIAEANGRPKPDIIFDSESP
jgi:hypothetical protein